MPGQTQITFGIEIECYIPRDRFLAAGLTRGYHREENRAAVPAGTGIPSGWTIGSDGSLGNTWRDAQTGEYPVAFGRDGAEYIAVEIVSPPLKATEAGIKEVLGVVKYIKSLGGVVDSSCGGHVHVGAREILRDRNVTLAKAAKWAQKVVEITAALEDGIFSYSGGSVRKGNGYCHSVKPLKGQTAEHIANYAGRYRTVNLQNLLMNRMTVEFRLFAGTLVEAEVEANIRTAVRICRMAKHDDTVEEITGISAESLGKLQAALWGKARFDLSAKE